LRVCKELSAHPNDDNDDKREKRFKKQGKRIQNKHLIKSEVRFTYEGKKGKKSKQGAKEATFTIELPAGKTTLTTWLTNDKGETGGAYFTEVELLNAAAPAAPSTPTSFLGQMFIGKALR